MNGIRQVPLSEVVQKVSTWDPRQEANDASFQYIDLSAIDQDCKCITASSNVLCGQAPSRARQRVAAGDVLVATVRPNLNAVAMVTEALDQATASTGFCVLRPIAETVFGRYLFHWVRTPQFVANMVRYATGASYPAVSDRIVLSSLIPLPRLAEQRRIADILDRADSLRARRRRSITQVDALARSVFLETFGEPVTNPKEWPVLRLGDILATATYGTSRKASRAGALPILRMGNLTATGEIVLSDLKRIDLPATELERHTVRQGDVLFNRTNSAELVGKTAVVRSNEPMAYAGYLVRLRCAPAAHPEFVGAFLNLPSTKRRLRSMCKAIVGMANINAREVQSLSLPVPPRDLQDAFAVRISVVRLLLEKLRRSGGHLDILFSSLQHQAFRGEL